MDDAYTGYFNYLAAAFKSGISYEQFLTLDYKTANLLLKARLKAEEERINNNIITGAKSALKVVQYYSSSKKAEDMQLVDYKIQLDLQSTPDRELETYRSQFNLLKSHGINPIKFILRKEEEVIRNGRQG